MSIFAKSLLFVLADEGAGAGAFVAVAVEGVVGWCDDGVVVVVCAIVLVKLANGEEEEKEDRE